MYRLFPERDPGEGFNYKRIVRLSYLLIRKSNTFKDVPIKEIFTGRFERMITHFEVEFIDLIWMKEILPWIWHPMMTTPSTWVQERRLRPIYELLDGGNNKKVVTEVERLLKKQPNFSCAKVLKALALIRMGKPDEARMILQPVTLEVPTDDGTIQALSICYRELDDAKTLCALLEHASQKEESEELLTHTFMAQVRLSEFKKMYLTASKLHRNYKKNTYFGWQMASKAIPLLFKQIDNLQPMDTIDAELEIRGMESYIKNQKNAVEDNLLYIHLRLLEHLKRYDKLLEQLKSLGYPPMTWTDDSFHTFYVVALEKLQKHDELFQYLKGAYMKNPEQYDLLKQIIDKLGSVNTPMIDSFLEELYQNSPNRAVVLADMYFSSYLHGEVIQQRIFRDLKATIKYGLDKPSFYADVADFFTALDLESKKELVALLAPVPEKDVPNFDTITKIIRDVNYESLNRELIQRDDTKLSRLRHANICFGKYLVCDQLMDSLHTDGSLRTKEPDFHDAYVVMAALDLLCEFTYAPQLLDPEPSIENIFLIENYLKSAPWSELGPDTCDELHCLHHNLAEERLANVTNGTEDKQNKFTVDALSRSVLKLDINEAADGIFNNREVLLLYAITVLEYGLARSPHNYSIRLLLSKAYGRMGAVGQAIKVLQPLDLKHVQWDTLGYLIFPQALASGTYHEAHKMLVTAEAMYTNYRRESLEHVITAYKYGSFEKVLEFQRFRGQLLGSVQFSIIFTEKRLMDLLMFVGTSMDLSRLAEMLHGELVAKWKEDTDTHINADNRDFTVLRMFENELDLHLVREKSCEENVFVQRFRNCVLFVLVKLINYSHAEGPIPEEECKAISNLFNRMDVMLAGWRDVIVCKNPKEIEKPNLYGIWPGLGTRYFESPCPASLFELLRITKSVVLFGQDGPPGFDCLPKNFELLAISLMKILRDKFASLKETKRLVDVDAFLRLLHYILEIYSFSRILMDVQISTMKKQMEKNRTKAKAKERNSSQLKQSVKTFIQKMHERYVELYSFMNEIYTEMRDRPLPTWDNMTTKQQSLYSNSFLAIAIPEHFFNAQLNIRDSHLCQMDEMRRVVLSLIEYIRGNFTVG